MTGLFDSPELMYLVAIARNNITFGREPWAVNNQQVSLGSMIISLIEN